MKSRDFCYWLQGFFELNPSIKITPKQISMIKKHLSLVFNQVTKNKKKQPRACSSTPIYCGKNSFDKLKCRS